MVAYQKIDCALEYRATNDQFLRCGLWVSAGRVSYGLLGNL